MDMGIDLGGTPFWAHASALGGEPAGAPDWRVLQARLSAQHAARAAFLTSAEQMPAASFDCISARVLGTYPEGSVVV